MPVFRSFEQKRCVAKVYVDDKKYEIICAFYEMLEDKQLSWEAKGFISYCMNINGEFEEVDDILHRIFKELINANYAIEVK